MLVGELLSHGPGPVLRVIGTLLLRLVKALLVVAPGELLLWIARPGSTPRMAACVFVSSLFWVLVTVLTYGLLPGPPGPA